MIEICIIDETRKADINIPNAPFPLYGRMIPAYSDGEWSYRVEEFPESQHSTQCFPDENYDYDAMKQDSVFIGAYDSDKCVGLAIMQDAWFKYMYLYDLKVNAECRGRHVGAMLIAKCKEVARSRGYTGVYTQGQDNNLGACLFYLRQGFVIGGLNTHVYNGTAQAGKSDIFFYLN